MLAIKARILLDKLISMFKKEEGQGLVEYGLILALVAIVVVGALSSVGQTVTAKFTEIVGKITGGGAA